MKVKQGFQVLGGLIAGVVLGVLLMGSNSEDCNGPQPTGHIRVTFFDFSPSYGDFDINWPGPPRRPWNDSDKEYYTATVELLEPAPCRFSLPFYVKSARWFWSDPTLAFFTATFMPGERVAKPQFWLVCTKKGRPKGNVGKNNDRDADVYLDPFDEASVDCPVYWEVTYDKVWKHVVRCE